METPIAFNQNNASSLIEEEARTTVSPATMEQIVGISALFFTVGSVGMIGNLLVMYIVLSNAKMRKSMTNMLITNLAIADSAIMIFGIPEILQFMQNDGWVYGLPMCKIDRFVLVTSLYASVLTLVAVCIERFIGIVFPIQAHIVCTRRRTTFVICIIWIFAILCGLPTLLFNTVTVPGGVAANFTLEFCVIEFPGNHLQTYIYFKYSEFLVFYALPLIIQTVCYYIICRRLFVGVEKLHRSVRQTNENGQGVETQSEAVKARKSVVKMLIASVVIYFLSYSPHQILLIYNTFASGPFHETWAFLVFVTALAYCNSAANPVLYCIFSQTYRRKFMVVLSCGRYEDTPQRSTVIMNSHYTEYTSILKKSPKHKTDVTAV